ncbi:hypothetical protein ACIBQ5_35660 [Streptomyces massasporeus]|uniref:hypothetical protein n=1 Tax=Streptomyces massasporeus TaxID=67324 RepID=UPI0037B0F389
MTDLDPDTVPATPIYTITVSSNGAAALDGEEITGPGGDPAEARVAALAEVRIKAALRGRPVRVNAKEADGSTWPLIVAVDGSVTTLDHPHPTPPPPPAPQPAQAPPAPRSAPQAGGVAVPTPQDQAAARTTGGQMPAAAPTPAADEWAAPLPASFRILWGQLVAQEHAARNGTGSLADAIVTAHHLETALAQQYGPQHPYTVNVMTVRAWLTLRNTTAWAETVELLVETAQRRQETKARPAADTDLLIRNAHAAWRKLTKEDPESAREIAEQVLTLLVSLPTDPESPPSERDAKRARDVVHWIESGAAA